MRIHSTRQMNFAGRTSAHKNERVNEGMKEEFRKAAIIHFRVNGAHTFYFSFFPFITVLAQLSL